MRNENETASPRPKSKIDPHLFRRTMGAFATGVTIVTVDADGPTHGMTANAFMSGSLEPPLCVVSVAKRAHTHEFLREAKRFGVNILGADQQDLALYFAGKKSLDVEARFERVADAPLLRECTARIAARVSAEHDCGDHTLFVGAILHMDVTDRPPLLYHKGAFGSLSPKMRERVPAPEFW
jgi:flavin reductase